MKKSELQEIIREEIRKALTEATSKFQVESFDQATVGKKYGNLTSKHLYTKFEDLFFDTLQRVININKRGFKINGQTDVKQVLNIALYRLKVFAFNR